MPSPPAAVTNEMRLAVAAYAKAQIGKPYVFGTYGPKTWDCSGLTMDAWYRTTGVVLPHNAEQQAAMRNSLMLPIPGGSSAVLHRLWRGDLVFFYDPITHCALYDGWDPQLDHRMIVQASNEERGLERIGLFEFATPVAVLLIGHV